MTPRRRNLDRATTWTDDGHLWQMETLAEPWTVHMRLEAQHGVPVVAELRITCDTDEVPPGGLPARLLRDVRFGAMIDEARETIASNTTAPRGAGLRRGGFDAGARAEARSRPGRRGHPDSFYVALASAYLDAVARGSRQPAADAGRAVDRKNPVRAERVSELLHKARRRGLLTQPPPGRAGGELTDKARALLEQQKKGHS